MLRWWQIGKVALLVAIALMSNAFAADSEDDKLKVSGFVDGYFAFNTTNSQLRSIGCSSAQLHLQGGKRLT